MIPILPHSDRLDIGALSQLFSHKTNSYKYLFFLSLLQVLKERNFKVHMGIALADLEIEMLVTAWYPHIYFKADESFLHMFIIKVLVYQSLTLIEKKFF